VPQQLLGDPRVDAGSDKEARRAMPEIMEPHPRQPGAFQKRLEMLRQPRATTDRQTSRGHENEPIVDRDIGPLGIQAFAMLEIDEATQRRAVIEAKLNGYRRLFDSHPTWWLVFVGPPGTERAGFAPSQEEPTRPSPPELGSLRSWRCRPGISTPKHRR
jgi:hypothetical protein